MKRLCYLVLVGVVSLGVAGVSSAIPQLINYQGYLTDNVGVPVADGNYGLTFGIYDVETGGTAVWTETHATVPVTNGLFNVILGGDSPLTLPFDADYWLGVQIGAEPELSRIRLTSVGYSYRAGVADFAVSAENASHAVYADSAGVAGPVGHADTSDFAWHALQADLAVHSTHADTSDYAWNADMVDGYHAGNSPDQVPVSNGAMCTNLNADMIDGLHASEIVSSAAANTSVDWFDVTSSYWEAIDSVSFNLPRAGNVLVYGSTYFNIWDPSNTIVSFVLASDSLTGYYYPTLRFLTGVAPFGLSYSLGGYHAQSILSLSAGAHKFYLLGLILQGSGHSEVNYRSIGVVYLGTGTVKESSAVIEGLPASSSRGGR